MVFLGHRGWLLLVSLSIPNLSVIRLVKEVRATVSNKFYFLASSERGL